MKQQDILEQAGKVAESYETRTTARLIPITKTANGTSVGMFEGCGFNPSFSCPDTECVYFKFAGFRSNPHCCHPAVPHNLEIGGISRCWGVNNPNKPLKSFWNKLKNFFGEY